MTEHCRKTADQTAEPPGSRLGRNPQSEKEAVERENLFVHSAHAFYERSSRVTPAFAFTSNNAESHERQDFYDVANGTGFLTTV